MRTGDPLSLEPLEIRPLDAEGDTYLSIGGEIRLQYQVYINQDFGLEEEDDNGYLLQRYLLHADLHVGTGFRVFGQLQAALVNFVTAGQGPSDENALDVHQAFFDVRPESSVTLRAGRQEMLYGSQRLISVREGLNARRTFDAVRVLTTLGAWSVDGFFSQPVETDPGTFDDGGLDHIRFWGVYSTWKADEKTGPGVDLYDLGFDQPDSEYDQGTAHELRHSVGARLFGKSGGVDYNFESFLQVGRFGPGAIRAWTLASDTGYSLRRVP